jgi:hypothetical protein
LSSQVAALPRFARARLAAILAALAPAPGWAAAPAAVPYAVSFAGGDGCPREDEVGADVAAHVHDPSRAAGARVDLRVTGGGGRFTGELVATDAAGNRGRRAVDGDSCAEVAHALAFLAGMALELGGRLEAPAAAPAPPPVAPARATTWVPERAGPAFAGVAALSARGGIAPGLRPVGEIGIELIAQQPVPPQPPAPPRAAGWAPALRVTAMMGQGRADGASAPLDLLLTGGRVQFCPVRIARGRFEGRPCAAAEIGAVRATGDGAAGDPSGTFLWAAGEASLHVRWWATPELFVDAGAGALFPAVRTRYAAAPGEITYAVPAVTGRFALAAGLRL